MSPLLKSIGVCSLLLVLGGAARAQALLYDNLLDSTGASNASGFGYAHGDATLIGTNTITDMAADDIMFATGSAGKAVTGFTFSVVNFNTTATTFSAHVRF